MSHQSEILLDILDFQVKIEILQAKVSPGKYTLNSVTMFLAFVIPDQ